MIIKDFVVHFQDWECAVKIDHYHQNGRIALFLVGLENGERIACATINLDAIEVLEPEMVAIKNYSENVGMLAALMAAGVVHSPDDYIPSGFVLVPVCRLAEDFVSAVTATYTPLVRLPNVDPDDWGWAYEPGDNEAFS